MNRNRGHLANLFVILVGLFMGGYFTVAAVQGDYGLFRRLQLESQVDQLSAELRDVQAQVAILENQTRRLSDDYLDLDLLDERTRLVLGFVRHDEIVIR